MSLSSYWVRFKSDWKAASIKRKASFVLDLLVFLIVGLLSAYFAVRYGSSKEGWDMVISLALWGILGVRMVWNKVR